MASRSSTYQRGGVSRGSIDSELYKSSSVKKPKDSSFKSIMRKLFGRKAVRSQISLPTPTKPLDNGSTAFLTSPRAVSMPTHEVTRASALGSHSPLTFPQQLRDEVDSQYIPDRKPPRPRRASLPSIVVNSPHLEAQPIATAMPTATQDEHDKQPQTVDDEYIGFAVTSGSNPKRRSRSADAMYDTSRAHRMSPIQWRQWRRRSDEIRYWRDSVAESPQLKSGFDAEDLSAPAETPEEGSEIDKGIEDGDNRHTFDFGILASSLHEQEKVGIEERVVTMEVKMMDLEYAISKMQARSVSPGKPSPQNPYSTQQEGNPSTGSDHLLRTSPGAKTSEKVEPITHRSLAQPTPPPSGDSMKKSKPRPTSIATTVRPEDSPSPAADLRGRKEKPNRASITSLTIDHYTTLIGLVRREQAARIRLEDQVSDLQDQVTQLKSLVTSAKLGMRPWHGESHCERGYESLPYRPIRPDRDYEESETDDGFQEVYETPTERKEFEGSLFDGPLQGEAF